MEAHPFEDDSEVERLSRSKDLSLFCIAGNNKKRPNSIIMGRLFDYHVLDMMEFTIDPAGYRASESFGSAAGGPQVGNKPLFLFTGPEFDNNEEYGAFKSLFLDFFRGQTVKGLDLDGVRHVISCTALPGKRVLFTVYVIKYTGVEDEKEPSAYTPPDMTPEVDVQEIGPRAVLEFRRTRLASPDMAKVATQAATQGAPKKQKNVTKKNLEGKAGVVFPKKQDVAKLARSVKLPKALRAPKAKRPKVDESASATMVDL